MSERDSGASSGGLGAVDAATDPDVVPVVAIPDKLDVLFMIDNSVSMRDKQDILRLANVNLVAELDNPGCVAADGSELGPPPRGGDCQPGQRRAFKALRDINIAIISSSLGDAGADVVCAPGTGDRVDMAHLIGSLPRGAGTGVSELGFLDWRAGRDVNELNQSFQSLVSAVGEDGCGWEMSLESWYRFLVDPAPYRRLERVPCSLPPSLVPDAGAGCVQPVSNAGSIELDTELLAQRAAFLRPDSLLAIVMLTDENDCSIALGPENWRVVAVDDPRPMWRGSSTCDTNPNHPCCYACVQGAPPTCSEPLDPVCAGPLGDRLPVEADGKNLRCFEQRRRFGIDFLYPTRRYVNALREPRLCTSSPSLVDAECLASDLVDNPLYASGLRSASDVFLAGIVGVPWQRLAASVDARGNPLPADALRFKSAAELTAGDWASILGEPEQSPPIPPGDPFMRESSAPRPGIDIGNPINGREYDTSLDPERPGIPDDLEYACIFPLPAPRDCSQVDPDSGLCDCLPGNFDRPVCEQTPGDGAPGTTQHWAKAYPGLRQLDVLRAYGANSVVSSICARNVDDASRRDFAYRPAIDALLERIRARLGE